MDRKTAERLLVDADRIAEFVLECFDLTLEAPQGRELYDRAFSLYLKREAGDVPLADLYDALKGHGELPEAPAA